jgi:N-acetylmuramoyl-L-alanine amidase
MFSRSISASKLSAVPALLVVLLVACGGPRYTRGAAAVSPAINVVYPKLNQTVTAVDSTFILGSVVLGNEYRLDFLRINGDTVAVDQGGGFLAFLPVHPGEFQFELEAQYFAPDGEEHCLTEVVPVNIPLPVASPSTDSLAIVSELKRPVGDLILIRGGRLEVSFLGTPSCRAWFEMPGVADSIAMAEDAPKLQPYWGEAVFGAGAVPDSLKISGIYTGFYEVPFGTVADTIRVKYHLAPPDHFNLIWQLLSPLEKDVAAIGTLLALPDTARDSLESAFRVSLNDPSFPFTVRFTDSVQTIRHEPIRGYFSIFQPEGVQALAVGAEGDWYKLRLSRTQSAWAHRNSVEKLQAGILPPRSKLKVIRTYGDADKLVVEFPLSGKHPFRVFEDDRRTIRVQLFGVTSDTDWIRYDFSDKLIDLASWSQPEEDLYELKLLLTEDIWGYDSYYRGNTFYFVLNKPPIDLDHLAGKTIVIDPGHSSDPGAIGPTGYTEAQANLAIALTLREMLLRKGVKVVMTRSDDSHVELYDRPAIALLNDADLFVSIHNNALPDGVNPFVNNGTSSYYYHPHSINLARAIHAEMLKETGLSDYGLYHGNLAVNRPTQYPAVLVECAFIILPEREAILKTSEFRKKVARGIVKGIESFLKEFKDD